MAVDWCAWFLRRMLQKNLGQDKQKSVRIGKGRLNHAPYSSDMKRLKRSRILLS